MLETKHHEFDRKLVKLTAHSPEENSRVSLFGASVEPGGLIGTGSDRQHHFFRPQGGQIGGSGRA